jgi:hypothetical protein
VTGWQAKHFVLSGVLAATTFVVAFALGSGIIAVTGVPATGGIANIFLSVLIVAIGVQIARVPGFATLTTALIFLFAIPTLIGGPPGVYKVANGVLIGLTFDVVAALTGRRRYTYIIGGSAAAMVSILSIYIALVLLRLPGAEKLRPLLLPLTALQGVLGALGGWAAVLIFERRLQHLSAVKRLMGQGEASAATENPGARQGGDA